VKFVRRQLNAAARGKLAQWAGVCLSAGSLYAADADINRDLLPGAPKRDMAAPKLSIPAAPSDQWRKDLMKEVTAPSPREPIPLPSQTPRVITREQEEAMDKKRNWIFVSPQDAVTKPEEALRVRNERPKDEPYRSVMLQFLDQDASGKDRNRSGSSTNRSDGSSSEEAKKDEKKKQPGREKDPLNQDPLDRGTLKGDLQLGNWGRREDPLSIRALNSSSGRSSNEASGSNATSRFTPEGSSNVPGFATANGYFANPSSAGRDTDDQRRQRNQEFQDLLNRRAYPTRTDGSSTGTLDPINQLTDPTVSALGATAPRGMNTLPTAPRLSVTAPSPVTKPITPGLPDNISRSYTLPATTTPTVQQPQRPIHQPKPNVLVMPQRKL
jgi:hypothetical protein